MPYQHVRGMYVALPLFYRIRLDDFVLLSGILHQFGVLYKYRNPGIHEDKSYRIHQNYSWLQLEIRSRNTL